MEAGGVGFSARSEVLCLGLTMLLSVGLGELAEDGWLVGW